MASCVYQCVNENPLTFGQTIYETGSLAGSRQAGSLAIL